MPSLMADSYGFKSQEELMRVQKYCQDHRGWQLEQVTAFMQVSCTEVFQGIRFFFYNCEIQKLSQVFT